MAINHVSKFSLDGTEITVKDPQARADISTLNSDIGGLGNRVTALESLSRLSVSYSSSTETINLITGTHN